MNPNTQKRHIKVVSILSNDGINPVYVDGKPATKTTYHPIGSKKHFEKLNTRLPDQIKATITEHDGDRKETTGKSQTAGGRGGERGTQTGTKGPSQKSKNKIDGDTRNHEADKDDSLNKDGGAHDAHDSDQNENADTNFNDPDEGLDIGEHEVNSIPGARGEGRTASKKEAAPKKAAAKKAGSKSGRSKK
jgi:hypothetical protein